jgi:uncharacterized protein (TIGR03435 family)
MSLGYRTRVRGKGFVHASIAAMMCRALPFVVVALAPGLAQRPTSLPAFEVASLKISPTHGTGLTSIGPFGTERFSITNSPMELLLQIAFEVQPYQILGEPKWFDSERYDLTAKAEDGIKLTPDELPQRLQRLLAERMKLEVHREKKEFSGFALIVAKGGPKLKQSVAAASEQGVTYPGGMRLPHATLDWLASMLFPPLGRPVENKTGITDSFDIELTYAREGDANSSQPSLFAALQEQLGLQLEPQKVKVEMLVIDRMERVPAEN